MFKSRLSAWKFTKNSSDKEYQICAVLHRTRRDRGKPHTIFIINGNRRTLRDLFKYIKGRKMTVEDFYALAARNVTADQLVEEEQQVRAVTPDPDEEFAQDSDGDSDHDDGALLKLTPTSSEASIGNGLPTEGWQRPHRPSTSSASTSGRNFHSIEPRSVPLYSPVGSQPTYIQTPEAYGTSPTHHAGPSHPRRSPRRSFDRRDIESLAHSTIYSNPLRTTYGADTLDAWAVLSQGASDTSSLSDFDVICSTCFRSTSDHSSPCAVESPESMTYSPTTQRGTRDILNPMPNLPSPAERFEVPASTRQSDHSWKWVSHCFSACIYYSRGRYTDNSDHNLIENTPVYVTAPDDFMFARYDLDRANDEFRAMILSNDQNILVAINHTAMVLGMHNWNSITKHIMANAADVAKDILGAEHPISLLARFV